MITSRSPSSPQQDVPPVLALLGFGLVVGGFFFLESPTTFKLLAGRLDAFYEAQTALVYSVVFTLAINGAWLFSILARALGLRKQGSRLEVMTGRRSGTRGVPWKTIGASAFLAALGFCLLSFANYPSQDALLFFKMPAAVADTVLLLLRLNLSFSVFVVGIMLARAGLWKDVVRFRGRNLPKQPMPENSLVLGSVEEDQTDKSPEWAISNLRGLNGNILITGSIGTGKTQGTILPFLDQILGNFQPRPSILAIDPKGTFIPVALKIIEKHGLSKHVLHMRLGGDVTFNPIYHPQLLKGTRFLDTAQMIRAAAINFMGKSLDSPFWEISAFNLIKNSLVLCGAKYRESYFGLPELYKEMVEASKDASDTSSYLRGLAIDPSHGFDNEERYNIECGAQYFEEYRQFDDKVKTGVLATSTAFLNQFQEFQASQIFCPKLEDATIKGMDDVIDEGKILLFDISSPALARSMGTFVKLHFQQSVLNRMNTPGRKSDRTAILIVDEYQDVVSTGGGMTIGDDRFCAKNREANGIAIAATQSLTSLKNSIGKDDAAKELVQNFRTVIAGHSSDIATIKNFQELAGQENRARVSHSVSENSHHPSRNLMLGGFETNDANITESISTSEQKEYTITGREFSRLTTFETFAMIYDGKKSEFKKLFLKPYFLTKKNILHKKVLEFLTSILLVLLPATLGATKAYAFPNVCTVVKSSEFRSCLDFKVNMCMCGWPVPRPCARFEYYVPQTFIETFPDPKDSYFGSLPGAAIQLATLGKMPIPFGAEGDDDTQSFQAHALGVPLTSIPFSLLPCGGARMETMCFDAMSEHLGSNWNTGLADSLQPNMLAWGLSPKSCLLKGALTSGSGGSDPTFSAGLGCSFSRAWLPKYPPSSHSACTGWGVFYPRSGVYNGPSQTTGALMVASRIKSLGSEVFGATPSSGDEVWQMIYPQTSSCFREGQNVGILDVFKNVREIGRLTSGKLKGHLFTVWSKVSCCRDLAEVPAAYIAIEAMNLACQGLGAL